MVPRRSSRITARANSVAATPATVVVPAANAVATPTPATGSQPTRTRSGRILGQAIAVAQKVVAGRRGRKAPEVDVAAPNVASTSQGRTRGPEPTAPTRPPPRKRARKDASTDAPTDGPAETPTVPSTAAPAPTPAPATRKRAPPKKREPATHTRKSKGKGKAKVLPDVVEESSAPAPASTYTPKPLEEYDELIGNIGATDAEFRSSYRPRTLPRYQALLPSITGSRFTTVGRIFNVFEPAFKLLAYEERVAARARGAAGQQPGPSHTATHQGDPDIVDITESESSQFESDEEGQHSAIPPPSLFTNDAQSLGLDLNAPSLPSTSGLPATPSETGSIRGIYLEDLFEAENSAVFYPAGDPVDVFDTTREELPPVHYFQPSGEALERIKKRGLVPLQRQSYIHMMEQEHRQAVQVPGALQPAPGRLARVPTPPIEDAPNPVSIGPNGISRRNPLRRGAGIPQPPELLLMYAEAEEAAAQAARVAAAAAAADAAAASSEPTASQTAAGSVLPALAAAGSSGKPRRNPLRRGAEFPKAPELLLMYAEAEEAAAKAARAAHAAATASPSGSAVATPLPEATLAAASTSQGELQPAATDHFSRAEAQPPVAEGAAVPHPPRRVVPPGRELRRRSARVFSRSGRVILPMPEVPSATQAPATLSSNDAPPRIEGEQTPSAKIVAETSAQVADVASAAAPTPAPHRFVRPGYELKRHNACYILEDGSTFPIQGTDESVPGPTLPTGTRTTHHLRQMQALELHRAESAAGSSASNPLVVEDEDDIDLGSAPSSAPAPAPVRQLSKTPSQSSFGLMTARKGSAVSFSRQGSQQSLAGSSQPTCVDKGKGRAIEPEPAATSSEPDATLDKGKKRARSPEDDDEDLDAVEISLMVEDEEEEEELEIEIDAEMDMDTEEEQARKLPQGWPYNYVMRKRPFRVKVTMHPMPYLPIAPLPKQGQPIVQLAGPQPKAASGKGKRRRSEFERDAPSIPSDLVPPAKKLRTTTH